MNFYIYIKFLPLQTCFAIFYRLENQRQYELKAATETDCKMWIDSIREARYRTGIYQV